MISSAAVSAVPIDPLVSIQDVWVSYDGRWVLKSIYLTCNEGEILGVVGPNGGGKSTLLKVILGLVTPDRGTVALFGQKPDKTSRIQVGYLPQISQADRSFPVKVKDVVMMGLYRKMGLFTRFRREHEETALTQLNQVGMVDHADRPFGVLSGGQQQRVNIARALVSNPRLLILDEPSTGVDSIAQEEFYELLAKLRDERGMSVIMVSHDIGVITAHADQVACLNRQIHYHGDPNGYLDPDIQDRFLGRDLKVMVHDSHCVSCRMRHMDHD
ncbi:MAG TPA: ABC transporter ATP-binding protein [Desulfatirhabdiaceae bacterium]|nr:ABC transporter ATP-binding protein [Desulfatirhabdiaceae bacterium]